MNRYEELLKIAEMALREAPAGTITPVPPVVRDGKILHPNLTETGELRKSHSRDKKALLR
jgi:hypothetical protein